MPRPAVSSVSAPRAGDQPSRSGILYAVSAYAMWGFLPAYFLLLLPSGAFEIVAIRIFFSLAFCVVIITVTRAWPAFVAIVRQPRLLFTMGLAGLLIYVNWQTYVIGATGGNVVETALGYFINPIVTILLGVVILGERLRIVQWVALGISVVAVGVLTVGFGSVPWIALILAFSFGLYGFVKKRIGPVVDAVSGLTLETLWLLPVAAVQTVIVAATPQGLAFGSSGTAHVVLMVGAGVITAVPLLLFASAAKRLPLVYMGFIQYIAPILQFLFGVFIMKEPMPVERWIGFGLVWLALIVLTVDMIRTSRSGRMPVAEPV
ncbi:chloramphenicol-sensitive protein RarD [Agreia bicolorata]|uniref:Chloramphenicol-sensitive protein RarD n=1 Tax=Agreia bicolorata TaxID=110935 RepID=A0A1T4XP92_9MICO|nr:EamA family transporter RarD [Agreia bicolorata]SKA91380.1 chloramphenicol-sensitive protein RarD [Agreia bicolorata]